MNNNRLYIDCLQEVSILLKVKKKRKACYNKLYASF